MTIITYKDGIMAADSASFRGYMMVSHNNQKIIKTKKGYLVGASGKSVVCDAFRKWATEHHDNNPDLEWVSDDDEFQGIIVIDDRIVFEYFGKDTNPTIGNTEYYSIGAAYEMALGAMHAGASAEQAVAICIKYHAYCAGEIKTLKL